jgi:uncharacterized protein
MMRKLTVLCALSVVLNVNHAAAQVCGEISRAGQFEDGVAAYQRGDFATALGLLQPLADQGNADAQTNLGVLYEKGQGVARDYRKAVRLYRLAAQQGHPDAQFNLGVMYYKGQGVAQGYGEAARLFRLAAEHGNAAAQSNLGFMYEKGQGVAQDFLRAHMWYSLAASRLVGDDGNLATEYRDIIAKRLSRAQVVRAQKMAQRCEASGLTNCD